MGDERDGDRELQGVLCQISDIPVLHWDDPMPLHKKSVEAFKSAGKTTCKYGLRNWNVCRPDFSSSFLL